MECKILGSIPAYCISFVEDVDGMCQSYVAIYRDMGIASTLQLEFL
jgi:hypothetical protein